jgi:hypothetical protein
MRTRSIDAPRAFSSFSLTTGAMLVATLALSNAAKAQEPSAATVPAVAATVMASIQRLDPTYVDLNPASGNGLQHDEDAAQHSPAPTSQFDDSALDDATGLVVVSENVPNSEAWDGFRHSVSGAATSNCFGPDALSHEQVAVQGLLRLPFLVGAASSGACR